MKTRFHDDPADLTDRPHGAGSAPEEQETVLVGRAADMAVRQPVLPVGMTLRGVTTDADMRRIAAMEPVVRGQDRSRLADDLIGRVASARTRSPSKSPRRTASPPRPRGRYSGGHRVREPLRRSTPAKWRGRGIHRAPVATRAALAVARGVTHLHVDAPDDSAPILRRLGLEAVTTTTPYVWSPRAA